MNVTHHPPKSPNTGVGERMSKLLYPKYLRATAIMLTLIICGATAIWIYVNPITVFFIITGDYPLPPALVIGSVGMALSLIAIALTITTFLPPYNS